MALVFDENGDVRTTTYDLQDEAIARKWATESASNKPWRPSLRASFSELLNPLATSPLRILELGSGPGLLAKQVLQDVPVREYVLFDFSEPMMVMAKEALGDRADVSYHQGDFKNHYGSRSVRGTEVAALFYSLIESAKLAGVGPHTYLKAAINAALRGGEIPLPHEMT